MTYDADQHVKLARARAICPPTATRPHYQGGFLAGLFPFDGPDSNRLDRDPGNISELGRRIPSRIRLEDADAGGRAGSYFWNENFPAVTARAHLPTAAEDQMFARVCRYADEIYETMDRFCRTAT